MLKPDMNDPTAMILDVKHTCIDGWHEFTADKVPGFFIIAEQDDLESAYHDIPLVLAALIEADFGVKVSVHQAEPYAQYEESLPLPLKPSSSYYSVEKIAA
jgi:hypothetical protein